jgi:phosphohistidine phosphatase SixA
LRILLLVSVAIAWCNAPAQAPESRGPAPEIIALVSSLQAGGLVILMRHASSPQEPPSAAKSDPANVRHERQLDDAGRSSAQAMGTAIRQLRIRIGRVLSSPTYRALETVRLAQLGSPQTAEELGDSGHSMQADRSGVRATWLQMQVAEAPAKGTNTLLVTHFPNIMEAFPAEATGLHDGEALIFRPNGHGAARMIARVPIDEWPRLAAVD